MSPDDIITHLDPAPHPENGESAFLLVPEVLLDMVLEWISLTSWPYCSRSLLYSLWGGRRRVQIT